MYFIKRIIIDDKQRYQSSVLVNHTFDDLSNALILLENSVRAYVTEIAGREAGALTKIIDIRTLDQVCQPKIDCVLLYRLSMDLNRILVYRKKSNLVQSPNWMWGSTEIVVPSFCLTDIFEIEEYTNPIMNIIPPESSMIIIGPTFVKIPKNIIYQPETEIDNEIDMNNSFDLINNSKHLIKY